MAQPTSATCLAAAKVNLYLDVLGRRDDGYHDLETLFLSVDWGDDVTVALEDVLATAPDAVRIALDASGPVTVPDGASNLAWRAAAAFVEEAAATGDALPGTVRITLQKRVPVGAGLGGGSADAAAVLRLLASLLPDRVPRQALHERARALGADVPYFLLPDGAAVGRDRGDRLEPVDRDASLSLILIVPPQSCDTAAVFRSFRRFRSAPPAGLQRAVEALAAGDAAALREAHYNALAFTVLKMHPPMRRFTADVERRLGREPAMSGSGSALFDILDAEEDARDILGRLEGLPGLRFVVRTRDASPARGSPGG